MGYIPRSDPRREAARQSSMWDMYVATERWDEAENLRPGSTWLAGIVRHSDVVARLPSSIRVDFRPRAVEELVTSSVILVGDPRNPHAAITSEGVEWRPWMEGERIR